MLDILFASQVGILSILTLVIIFAMLGYMGWKFAQLSKQSPSQHDS